MRARGIVWPQAWQSADNASHTGLTTALRDGGNLCGAAEVLELAFAQGGDTLLVSAEDLSALNVDALQRLKTFLGASNVTIVYYVRRWSDLLPSGWQEVVKQGHTTSFPENFVGHVRNPEASEIFNLELRLAGLIQVFGLQSLRLVSYSMLRDTKVDLFGHFARHFLNWWKATPLSGNHELNTSRGVAEIELVRRLNMIEFSRSGEISPSLRNRLDAAWPTIDAKFVLASMETSRRTMFLNDAFPGLHALHRRAHARYQAQIVEPAPPDLLFKPMRRELQYIADDYIMQPGVVAAIHEIYDRLAA